MLKAIQSPDENWLNLLDLSSIADFDDKLHECEYLFDLVLIEKDRDRFRWLINAFLNAAYSFFESSALHAFVSITDPKTGEPLEDPESVKILRRYVKVTQSTKDPFYVKTAGLTKITLRLYDLRKASAHHFPLSIMIAGSALPEDFHLGHITGKGTPAVAFCRDVLQVIRQAHAELEH